MTFFTTKLHNQNSLDFGFLNLEVYPDHRHVLTLCRINDEDS